MRIYFSGDNNEAGQPEILIPNRSPHLMLSFFSVHQKLRGRMVARRLKQWLKQYEDQKTDVFRRPKPSQGRSKSKRVH